TTSLPLPSCERGRATRRGSTWTKCAGWRPRWCRRMRSSLAWVAMCVAGAIVFHAGLKAGAIGNARQAGLQAGGTADRAAALEAGTSGNDLPFSFLSVGREAGLNAVTIFGGRETNRYLLETTGSGVA